MHILINKKKYRLTSSLQLLSSLPLLSTTAFLFVLHCCHIIFYELNWLSSCRPTSRSQTYMHIPRFSSSAVFIFFFTRAASLIFFLGSSGVVVWGNCWAQNVGVNNERLPICICNESRAETIEFSSFNSIILTSSTYINKKVKR